MKHYVLLFPFLVATLGYAESQKVTIKVYDALAQKPLEDAQVTLYVSHPPKAFWGAVGAINRSSKGTRMHWLRFLILKMKD